MKKTFLLLPVVLGLIYVICSGYHEGPASYASLERTGATGTTGCFGSSCHGTATTGTSGIAVTIVLDSSGHTVTHWVAGHSYNIIITGVNNTTTGSLPRFGFQLTSVFLSGSGTSSATNAGTFGTSLPTDCQLSTIGGTFKVIEHNTQIPATTGSGAGSGATTYSESIPWTAPATGTGAVKLFGVINAVNFDGSASAIDKWDNAVDTITEEIPVSTVGAITGTPTTCRGGSTILSDTTSGGSWSSSVTSIATVSATGVVFGVAPGVSVISYTVGSTTVTDTVTITAGPSAGSITGPTSVCAGATIDLSSTIPGGTWSAFSSSASVAAGTGVVTGHSAGTVTITYTTSGSCGTAVSTYAVTVLSAYTVGPISGASIICAGSTASLTDTSTTGSWSITSGSIASVSSSGVVTAHVTGLDTVRYIATLGACSDTASYPISVVTTPTAGVISVATTDTVCTGATITFSDATSTGGAGVWSTSSSSIATAGASTGVVTGVSASTTGTVIYTITNPCGTTSTTHGIVVLSSPSVGVITGGHSICGSGTLTLVDTVSGGTWSSTDSTVATVTAAGSMGFVLSHFDGTTVIRYTIFSTTCGFLYASDTVTVGSTASPGTIVGPTTVCITGTGSYSDTATGGTWSSSNPSVASISSSGMVTGVSAGTDTLSYIISGGCGTSTATYIITVSAGASAGSISGLSSVCAGSTIGLTDATGTSGGTWSSSNPSIATIGPSSGVVTGVSPGTDTITYTTPSSGCGVASTTYVITVTSSATAGTISGSSSVCTGSTISLSTSGTTGGIWSSISTAIATVIPGSGVVSGVSAGTDTIKYTVVSGCGTSVASFPVVVNLSPSAGTITGFRSVCSGSTVILLDAGSSSSGTWTSGATSIATIGATSGTVSGVSTGTAIMTYTVSSASCGSATDTFSVAVISSPAGGSITGGSTLCAGSTETLSDPTGTSGGTWSSSVLSVATIDGSSGVLSALSSGTTSIMYSITTSGCGSASATYSVTVNALPDAGTISGSSVLCLGSATPFSSSGTPGGTWLSSTTSVATVDAASGLVSPVAVGSTTISYIVSTTSCGSDTAVFAVTVSATASGGTISGPTTVCAGTTITLADGVSGGSWSSSDASIGTISSGGILSGVGGGVDTITYSVTTCGSATATYVVTVIALPTASTISGPTSVCAGSTISLTDGAGTGSWSSSVSTEATVGSSSGIVTGVSAGTPLISYTVSNSCGSVSATYTITVKPLPDTGTITGTASICIGSPVTLSESGSGGTWSSGTTSVATVDASGDVTGVAVGSSIISYTASNSCGTFSAIFPISVTTGTSAGTISGPTSVCQGASITLADGTSSGTWSSSAPGTASVDGSGNVTGVAAGSVVITYTVAGSCGTVYTTQSVTVNPLPDPGIISGTSVFCVATGVTLAETVSGGTWSSGNTSICTTTAFGNLYGVSGGTDTIYYAVSNGCGTLSAIFPVTIQTTPSAGSISGPGTVCTGSVITLSETASGGSWSSAATGTATVDASGNVTGVAIGTTNISYSVTNTCGTASTTQSVTVNLTASAGTISGATAVCPGSSITLSDATGGGTWSSAATGTATVSGSTVFGVAAGSVTISYTVVSTCGTAYATYAVTVTPMPSAGTISGAGTVCTGTSIALTDAAGGGTWSSSATGIATVDASGNVWGVSSGSANIIYTVTNSCGTATATKSVTVNLSPASGTISGTSSVCAGSTVTLTDAAGSGTWSSSATGVATVTSGGVVGGAAGGSAIISYTVTNSCGTSTATYAFTVNPLPNAGSISGSSTACVGSTTTLTDAAGSGTWSSSATSVATIDAGGNVYGVSAGTTNISYTVSNACGSVSAVVVETVQVTPTSAAISAITGGSVVCVGASITLSDATSGGIWSTSAAGIATVDAGGNVTGVTSGSANILYTISNSCGSANVSLAVTVNSTPTAGPISGASTMCSGTSMTLTDGSSGGVWTSSSTAVATIDPSSGLVDGLAAGTTNITYTITNSCGSAAVLHALTVNAIPSAGSITGPASVCPGATITLSDGATGGSWTSSTTSAATVSLTGIVTGVSSGSTTISYAVSGSCGTGYASYTITVNPNPDAGVISGLSTVCVGNTTALTDTTSGGVWNSGGTSIATVSSAGVVTGVSTGTVNIIYSVTNVCGTVSAAHSITVNTLLPAGSVSGTTRLCVGSIVTLAHSSTGGTWHASNSHATISTGGVLIAATGGIDTISYNFTNSCGTSSAVLIDTIDAVLSTGALAGPDTVCQGDTLHLTVPVPWGAWSSNNSDATITDSGMVVGVNPGHDTIVYSVTNTCGTHSAVLLLYVRSSADCGTSGVATVTNNEPTISVYPNPSTGAFTIEIPQTSAMATITITDMMGRELETRQVDNTFGSKTTFNLATMAAGNYLIKVTTAGITYREKIVIQ